MTLTDMLKLGRVSNLPTVWTNALAGMGLAGGVLADWPLLALLAAMTLFYIGGMYLNDAFDAAIDAKERPERPIPSGRVSRGAVFALGFGMLAGGLLLIWQGATDGDIRALISAFALVACIVFYDAYHKSNPLSPMVMGGCRALVYLTAAFAMTATPGEPVLVGAAMLLCYLIGLTYVAKQENLGEVKNMWPLAFLAAPLIYGVALASGGELAGGGLLGGGLLGWVLVIGFAGWILFALRLVRRRGPGDIPRAVVSLIAGMCLFDAMVLASLEMPVLALAAVGGFVLTLALQRYVPGT